MAELLYEVVMGLPRPEFGFLSQSFGGLSLIDKAFGCANASLIIWWPESFGRFERVRILKIAAFEDFAQ